MASLARRDGRTIANPIPDITFFSAPADSNTATPPGRSGLDYEEVRDGRRDR